MGRLKLQGKDLRKIGFPQDASIGIAIEVMHKNYKRNSPEHALEILKKVLEDPEAYLDEPPLSKIANALMDQQRRLVKQARFDEVSPALLEKLKSENDEIFLPAQGLEYKVYGAENIEQGAVTQMETAMRLPVSVAGALMPDAHQGYGLPIGGVLAVDNAVIPYAVGVDIGCRMCLSVFELDANSLQKDPRKFSSLLHTETLFGSGKEFKKTIPHEVLDRKEFDENPLLKSLQMKAAKQLGSSGSGNHFAEFGLLEIKEKVNEFGLDPGTYIGLLSHSGSRGLGASIANHYTRVAMEMCKLPKEAKHLAWLGLDTQEGMEYWLAMNLAGDYASACHHQIHDKISATLGVPRLARVENHHNFAWKENYGGKEVIVHRKGATPAGKGVLGIIPGSMTAPGYVVMGKGNADSLNSAAHGAGRRMSRTQAMRSITHSDLKEILGRHGVQLIGGGLDEAPHAYKNIEEVMRSQQELVEIIGTFHPKIVKMDG
jgi:tRNA-splicing ligase RtcB